MTKQRSIGVTLAATVALGIVTALLALPSTQRLAGRILEGDNLLRTQIESDFDRDGDIDFLDFTVFSALYEEEA